MKFTKLSETELVWNELFSEMSEQSPFLSYQWFKCISDCLYNFEPEVLVVEPGNEVQGIIPVIVKDDRIELIGDERLTDINGFICRPGYEREVMLSFRNFICGKALDFDLYPLCPEDKSVIILRELFSNAEYMKKDSLPVLELPDTWGEWMEMLEGKYRHEVRRKMRKANHLVVKDMEPDSIDILFDLMIDSCEEKDKFLNKEVKNFFRCIARAYDREGWLRYRVAFASNRPVGAVFGFELNGKVLLYNTGYNPEFYIYSPGLVTMVMDIRDAIEEGCKVYNFLRGEEKYKMDLGAKFKHSIRIRR